ncbi:4-(cytidine 5'-diphospho)-2-C-methyl-D-erythritol kinase [Bryobacter aggregatus]|uniref:4-(cytidine 5'-diphospho)-2-C-methyl-D-erythritol kinase n=1 Tax=Bryobacter aggregatus TaxID=360054 RepID=UPI00068BF28F|nr:4-(cytidine 5'-diphospho)-2-C-methyl-D-erythritol kinase [Bryobacter aggregatus]
MPIVPAFAKINLGLKVVHKRDDGFHEIATLFQSISLSDDLTIEAALAPTTNISVCCDVPIPGREEDNLAYRAALLVLEQFGLRAQISIHIAKRIPMGGGLGGGSTDAAAVLLALPALLGVHGDLSAAAAALGSDVPFFLQGGTCEASGRGEILTALPDPPPSYGVLIAPGLHVSTPDAYRSLQRPRADELTQGQRDAIMVRFRALVRSVHLSQPPAVWASDCENDFEPVAFTQHAQLEKLLEAISATGAQPARMSGSGSTLFGLYATAEAAAAAEAQLKADTSGHVPAIRVEKFQTISRHHYERAWHTALSSITDGASWPPRS